MGVALVNTGFIQRVASPISPLTASTSTTPPWEGLKLKPTAQNRESQSKTTLFIKLAPELAPVVEVHTTMAPTTLDSASATLAVGVAKMGSKSSTIQCGTWEVITPSACITTPVPVFVFPVIL